MLLRLIAKAVLCICLTTVAMVTTLEVGENYAIRPADQEWINSLFYIPTSPRIRQEYRVISDDQRERFHGAIIKMKKDRTVVPNKYDLLASLHARRVSRNSAHRGTGFLGWHRVYLLLFENALREQEPGLTIPYWDCTLEASLDLPRESSLFTEDFMGNGDGFTNVGVFKDWTVQSGKLYRTVGSIHAPLDDRNISHLMEFHYVANISYPLAGKANDDVFELVHNRVHRWIGGEMKAIETAADDPIFHPYHAFVSYVWEEFRTAQKAKGVDPELDWDEYYGQGRHHMYSPMGLGNLMASDGASEIFAENIVFEKKPSCSRDSVYCGSPYLYCNVTIEKCCPWTMKEYELIKSAASDANRTVKDIIEPYMISKLKKGFQTLRKSGVALPETARQYLNNDVKVEVMFAELYETEKHVVPSTTTLTPSSSDRGHGAHGHDHAHDHGNAHEAVTNDLDIEHQEPQGHDKGQGQPNEGHSHEGHDHADNVVGRVSIKRSSVEIFIDEYCIIILASLVGFRLIFAVFSKCKADGYQCLAGCQSRKQKYHMDGMVNINYEEELNKRPDHNGDVHRSDNIYTITVTNDPATGVKGTFVRFAKYTNGETHEKVGDKRGANKVTETSLTHGNYLDMNYGSGPSVLEPEPRPNPAPRNSHTGGASADIDKEIRVGNEARAVSDMFEHVAEIVNVNGGETDDDFDESYNSINSIENANFDFVKTELKEAIENGIFDDGVENRGFDDGAFAVDKRNFQDDLFDTYDNLKFMERRNEAEPEACSPCLSTRSNHGNHDDGYVNYHPVERM